MGWCLDCHQRQRVGAMVTPVAAAADDAQPALGGLDCGKCHY
jgi:hypothetical protein